MNPIFIATTAFPEVPTFLQLLENYPFFAHWMHFILFWEDIIFSFLVALIISVIVYFGSKQRELIPHGFQNFLELIVENVQKLVSSILGVDTDKHLPFIGTIFVYVLIMNIFGLIPFMKSPSSSLSISIGVALCVFMRVQYLNIKHMGIGGFIYHMCGSPKDIVGWIIAPLMLPIELITQISRPITLALRLTGNMMGEHTLIAVFAAFAVLVFSLDILPIGLPIQLPAMLFGIMTSLIQALVFALLSAVYILLSMPHESESH